MPDYVKKYKLGNGAFGEVWLVEDRALGTNCAVKYVPSSKIQNPTNFYQEPQTLLKLKHPNIVEVRDAGKDSDGQLYIAMEFLPKGSVEDFSKGGVVLTRFAIRIMTDVCRAMEYAHNLSYLHRDIKPGNILLAEDLSAKVSDFGLATKADAKGADFSYGYFAHLAPEVIIDSISNFQTDIYAMGITLYRLVNGDAFLPLNLDFEEVQERIIKGTFPDRNSYRPFIPQNLRTVINKAINIDPAKRFKTASEFRRKLEQVTPLCDWTAQVISNGTVWRANIGEMEYEATHGTDFYDKHYFTLEKGRIGVAKRRVNADSVKGIKKSEMERHIHKVLSRISATGR